ncbi:MAG: hypothetical protein NTV49_10675 [Kiritimatiellaeota bacterium]|nr:hypothetical protein [Kiritimatiellota bacterium]
MKTGKMELAKMILLGLAVVQMAGAQAEDAESAMPSLTISARQLAQQAGGRLLAEGLALAPGGRAVCVLNFPTRQVYTFILMARGEAEPWPHMEIRLNTNLVYGAAAASNWSSHAFTQVVAPGRQSMEIMSQALADNGARPAVLHIACLTITASDGLPAPVLVTNVAAAVAAVVVTNTPVPLRPLAAAATNPALLAVTNAAPVKSKWDAPVGR